MKKTVVIGISSGIAAYKILDLIKKLKENDLEVEVIETSHATKMIAPSLIQKETGRPVFIELYPKNFNYESILEDRVVDHIALADKADVFIVAPATANTVAKLAHGMADDFLTTTALAVTAPFIVCPSMNVHMWNNPAVQKNIELLRKRGVIIIEPEEGPLACGYEGKGRLASNETIVTEIQTQIQRTVSLHGKSVIVTAGGTSEAIDQVRMITNKSTGKMGTAIAEECYLRGATVILLRSQSSVLPRYQMETQSFVTSHELEALMEKYVRQADIVIHTAAVADFKTNSKETKLSSNSEHTVSLIPQEKIINKLRKWNPKGYIAGFKAECETDNKKLAEKAKKKLHDADVDMIVANDISRNDRGFSADTNEVTIITKTGTSRLVQLSSKHQVAKDILHEVVTDITKISS